MKKTISLASLITNICFIIFGMIIFTNIGDTLFLIAIIVLSTIGIILSIRSKQTLTATINTIILLISLFILFFVLMAYSRVYYS